MNNIEVYHTDWKDYIKLFPNNKILCRYSNKEKGSYIMNDNFLIILWDKWGTDFFYKKNNNIYEQVVIKSYIHDFSTITVLYENVIQYFLLDYQLEKIYKKDTLELIGLFYYKNNKLFINDNYYIFFNFIYYDYEYFNKFYFILLIDNIDYVFCKNEKICYENYMIFKKYNYYFYQKYIKIENKIYKKINNDNYTFFKNIDQPFILNDHNLDIIIQKINQKNICVFHVYENLEIIINTVIYLSNLNIESIVFDNINNNNYNYNHLNYFTVDVIYYENIDIYKKIEENCKNKINDFFKNDFINQNYIHDLWNILNKDHIEKYKILENKKNIIHFIWIGKNKIPNIYLSYIESWILHYPNYHFCFWNDNNIPILINQKYYDDAKTYAMKADILRYEILYFFGGIYVDTDFLSIKNIEKLIEPYDGFSAYESNKYIAIGLMGFKKYDTLLFHILKNIGYNIIHNIDQSVPEITGPIYFTNMWKKYSTKAHHAFSPKYFYSYTFKDKNLNKKYTITKDIYAIHTWGYSWKTDINLENNNQISYIKKLYLNGLFSYHNQKIKYEELDNDLNKKIVFHVNKDKSKIKVVHIMGLFFSGGIERYMYYIDKYGNHDKYTYYLLYISNDHYVYEIKNMIMISFDWNHNHLNELLIYINPDIIIDHYSLYIKDNSIIYKNISLYNIIYFVHGAILYHNDISHYQIKNCIHLYDEKNKHISWNNIHDFYVTLGTELNINNMKKENNNINVSIIGRISDEKIPLDFLKKLCNMIKTDKHIVIHIYGMKNKIFNKKYVEEFDNIIEYSTIKVHDFVDPNNMKSIYENTDVLLIPSIYETGSFTCIEAFSYGIPIICRNGYGLKHMITDGIHGYLCENDDDMIQKIINIKNDPILENKNIIQKHATKYNIIEKIVDLENIIDEINNAPNLVIITSVLNCVKDELSYYHTRNIFSLEERYQQTIISIESIRLKIPNVEILLCECSYLEKNDICQKVDYYYNFYENEIVRNHVNSKMKGSGEAQLLIHGLSKINKKYKQIFKLSGRYALSDNFEYEIFNNTKNIFSNWDNSCISYMTIFYKIYGNDIEFYKNALHNSLKDLDNNISIEQCMYKYFEKDIMIIDKMNVHGLLATEGYMIYV